MSNHTDKANNGPVLYIAATPIGNLGDISQRALDTLKSVDVIACEDTRVSKKLLSHFGISKTLISYHEHNAKEVRPKLLEKLSAGQSIALISDAGTPLISDPGYKLVDEALAQDIRVVPIPGASAVITALCAAGLPTNQFAFLGFLPTQRVHAVELLTQWKTAPATLVCFTTPGKVVANLQMVLEIFGECDVVLARELTKLHEEFIRGKASALLAELKDSAKLRGELVMLFRPCEQQGQEAAEAEKVDALLVDLLPHMPLKAAVDMVVRHTGQPKNQVYQRALALKG